MTDLRAQLVSSVEFLRHRLRKTERGSSELPQIRRELRQAETQMMRGGDRQVSQ